ncbi:MAG: acyl carrier protein [Ruminococcus sp.]|nr:acyl carrier protein [Ruminococcus sp.]MBR6386137.1 acyl carrier protein [Ruminococcus sp.]
MKANIEEVKQTIRGVLLELMEEDAVAKISDSDFFAEEMGIGSMTIVQIFVTCQEKYNVDLSNEMQLTEPMSIQTLAETVVNKTEQ